MLDTVRHYSQEKLAESVMKSLVRSQHLNFYLDAGGEGEA